MKYHSDRLEKFHVFTDQGYPGTDAFNKYTTSNLMNLIDGLLGSSITKFGKINDSLNAYKYILSKDRKNMSWYKKDLFTIYNPLTSGKSSQLYFILNNENNFLDDIVYRTQFLDIESKIKNNHRAYVVTNHAIERAYTRIPDLYKLPDKFSISSWILKRISKAYPAHVTKKYLISSLLSHDFQKADYYIDDDGFVFVVHDFVVLTVHGNESDRWKRN